MTPGDYKQTSWFGSPPCSLVIQGHTGEYPLSPLPNSTWNWVQRPGIVHRLDKDTTGVMVIAKTDLAQQHLQAQLKAKTARREYGVVYGLPQQKAAQLTSPSVVIL